MPATRHWNIGRIAWAWMAEAERHALEIVWFILVQGRSTWERDPYGMSKTNEALDQITHGWVMMLSDDSFHHPALFRRIEETIKENPESKAIVFSEKRPDGSVLRAITDNMKPCRVDGQQLVVERSFLGDRRFDRQAHDSQADGWLIQDLYLSDPSKFVFIDEPMLEFNTLD